MPTQLERYLSWRANNIADAKAGLWHLYDNIGMVSGGFDPLHIGHVRYLRSAAKFCRTLIIIVNGDSFLKRKKGYVFMPLDERCEILQALGLGIVIPYESESDTVIEMLEVCKPHKFFKGGDRTGKENIPEWATCERLGIEVITGVGGGKIQSSSELVKRI